MVVISFAECKYDYTTGLDDSSTHLQIIFTAMKPEGIFGFVLPNLNKLIDNKTEKLKKTRPKVKF